MLATLATRHLYFSKVVAARRKNLTTNRARKNKHTARKYSQRPFDTPNGMYSCVGRGKEARDETLRTTAWEARFAQTVNCFYGPYPFVYIGQPTSKGSNPLLLLSGILIYV